MEVTNPIRKIINGIGQIIKDTSGKINKEKTAKRGIKNKDKTPTDENMIEIIDNLLFIAF